MDIIVDLTYLQFYLHGLTGHADIDKEVERYSNVDSNNEAEMKLIIQERLKPGVEKYPKKFHDKMKIALSYSLTKNQLDFGLLYDSQLLPFDHPSNPRLFFIWIWEVLYGKESYLLANPNEFSAIETNINDVNDFLQSLDKKQFG
jgi:hypothetical protein